MMMLLVFFIVFLAMIPLFINHPLSVGLTLLIQTILIAMITGLMSLNFWISYLLFLVMVGGMLILFMYMTSIASNEKFYFSKSLMILTISYFCLMMFFLLFKSDFSIYWMKNFDSLELLNFSLYEYSPNKYFINNSKFILSILIVYLFITLIAIVNISSNNFGPLRQKL
uniref:NADH dehydrogenase subunit 6 n=1 Tax=Rhagonycha nigroimpressa TaxID=3027144 RepID=UPI0023D8A71D|nr:NADH dehydrogenase subunit 6 [Rhagonycha nigroimpressa]WCS40144.1 NADH dehydrogenase subunit 6 [Rhagonycha nigroimpressa]WRO44855.1 NADH dehydrogenase subunit 6 [Rhagonycha nigroimpressa]